MAVAELGLGNCTSPLTAKLAQNSSCLVAFYTPLGQITPVSKRAEEFCNSHVGSIKVINSALYYLAMKRYFESRPSDEALDRVIRTAQLQPLMSDAKWVRLLTTLVVNWSLVQACQVKLLWEEASVERWLLLDEETSYHFNYYAQAMEGMVSGRPWLNWTGYKEIEWLDFPRFPSTKTCEQDLVAIQQKIEAVGQFKIDASLDNLRLYAYLRP